jgi:hypothetical protein
VVQVVSFEGFVAGRNTDNGQVYIAGQLAFGSLVPGTASINVQFSKNGTSGWHTVSTIDLNGNPQQQFDQEFDHPTAGYWRVTYAGQPKVFESAVSPAVYVG